MQIRIRDIGSCQPWSRDPGWTSPVRNTDCNLLMCSSYQILCYSVGECAGGGGSGGRGRSHRLGAGQRQTYTGTEIPPLGGFSVSNLMGIKRRTIDIGNKITFYFFQNVWKCTVFSHLHVKFAKSVITVWHKKKLFSWKHQYGYHVTQNFMLISNSLMPNLKSA
jgi:hypothetical protein